MHIDRYVFRYINYVWCFYRERMNGYVNGVNALLIPTFWPYFYFGPYIFISLLLDPKPIDACYFNHFCQLTDGNS